MATAVVRATMTLGQNIHMIQNNCVYVSTGVTATTPSCVTIIQHGKRQIAPAPDHKTNVLGNNNNNNNNSINNNINNINDLRCNKKRINYTQITYGGNQPNSVARRNARERNRVQLVNNGFTNLRQHIPPDIVNSLTNGGRGASKKLSKVDTLKMAVEYIRRLQTLLDDANDNNDTASSSSNSITHKNLSSLSSSSSSYYSIDNHTQSLPPCSETSSSPTPSFTSESSISCHNNNNNSNNNIKMYAPTLQSYTHHDHCDSYGSMNSLDDDLLDVISSWQQE